MGIEELLFSEKIKSLRYNAKFSTDEIMPILQEKISSILGEEYIIDFFIVNEDNSSILDVYYLAFPKQESYMKASFIHDGLKYTYVKENDKNAFYKAEETNDVNPTKIDIIDDNRSILIAKEKIDIKNVFGYLIAPHNEKYLLYNDFFCYDEEYDELSNVITDFVKKKVPTK